MKCLYNKIIKGIREAFTEPLIVAMLTLMLMLTNTTIMWLVFMFLYLNKCDLTKTTEQSS